MGIILWTSRGLVNEATLRYAMACHLPAGEIETLIVFSAY